MQKVYRESRNISPFETPAFVQGAQSQESRCCIDCIVDSQHGGRVLHHKIFADVFQATAAC